ncbi:OpgC family protein [Salipiger abyssi]|uniref:OpgC family protein n=1 Tax=Salipiger abyssi TaxID=1250539 RepID=UPI00097782B2
MTQPHAPASAAKARQPRDPRLDFFRGLSLVMIYINHVPGTIFEHITSRNFGLSDAAEGFVFMSGCAVALAYGPRLAGGISRGALRLAWMRAWTLYRVHILTTLLAIVIVGAGVLWSGETELLRPNSFYMLWEDPLTVGVGLVTLGHQFGYINILPMYGALMLAAPFLVRLGQRRPLGLLALSVAIWVLSALFRIDLPNYPLPGGWFFNPFSWQLLFSLGILTGLALRDGRRFVPASRWLLALTLFALLYALVWVKHPPLMSTMNQSLSWLYHQGASFLFVAFDKTYVSAPRLLHFLALAYALSWPGLIRALTASRLAAPVRLLGRYALWVFATGTVLSIAAQVIKALHPAGMVQDMVLILGGLALQYAVAHWQSQRAKPRGSAPVAMPVLPEKPRLQTQR